MQTHYIDSTPFNILWEELWHQLVGPPDNNGSHHCCSHPYPARLELADCLFGTSTPAALAKRAFPLALRSGRAFKLGCWNDPGSLASGDDHDLDVPFSPCNPIQFVIIKELNYSQCKYLHEELQEIVENTGAT